MDASIKRTIWKTVTMMTYAFVFLVAFAPTIYGADHITAVTVYADRAVVTRTLDTSLPAGAQVVIFDHIPSAALRESFSVDGAGPVVLDDVRNEEVQGVRNQSEEAKKLEAEKLKLQEQLLETKDAVSVIEGEMKLVQNFVDTASRPADTSRSSVSDPTTWTKMLGFYRERLEALHSQLRTASATVVRLTDTLDKTIAQLEPLNANAGKPELRVIVGLTMKQAGDVRLELRYVVQGPAWHPSYDLRVSSGTKVMTLIYKAEVVQQTGELWKDVALTFSTAKPHIGASHPELSPWYVQSFDRYLLEQREYARRNVQMMNTVPSDKSASLGGVESELGEPMERAQAEVDSAKSSVSFKAARSATIESTGQPFQVTLAVVELPLFFRYSAAPKLSQKAFLKVKATNTTGFPLMSGKANCYLDTVFVASNELDYTAPDAEFWVFLGADERIIVDYQVVKEFEEKAGLGGKKTRKTLEYLTTITNHLSTREEMVVWDQLPIARNDEIEVKLLKPEYHGDTDSLKLSKEQFLEWYYKIEPGQTVTIPFSFSILYPENQVLRNMR